MDLLSKTFEKSTTMINGVHTFKMVHVKIDETISYHIERSCLPNYEHMIERTKRLGHGFSDRRYKLYADEKSFENAIKRIEKMAKKSLV